MLKYPHPKWIYRNHLKWINRNTVSGKNDSAKEVHSHQLMIWISLVALSCRIIFSISKKNNFLRCFPCSHVGWYTLLKVLVRPVTFSVDKSDEQYQLRRVQEELVMIPDVFFFVLLTIVWIHKLLIFFQCRHKHCSQHSCV